jgi:periplasmic divalent cation tolerance protein
MTNKVLVLVTCGKQGEAGIIARALIEQRLAACVAVLPVPVLSTYRWKNRIEATPEDVLLIKTSRKMLKQLEAAVLELHSYDVPELIALPIAAGSKKYLTWIDESMRAPRGIKKKNVPRRG